MTTLPSAVICAGCGAAAPPDEALPFRCPNAGSDDTDHVMQVVLDSRRLSFPTGSEGNPFVRYRTLLHGYHLAVRHGMTDSDYVALVGRLDDAVARVDGHGFAVTPFARHAALSDRLGFTAGGVWVKDETGSVAGSHKGRHLMGVLIYLEIAEALGPAAGRAGRPDLAIASCGNAALAAAVVAKAGARRLRVFVPPTADPIVLTRLAQLEAIITVCPRDGEPGDPTHRALRRAVAEGALPFTCQGPDNGLTIEGGKTLVYEMVSELLQARYPLDRVCVQVGGGALASAVVQALRDVVALGVLPRLPRIHAVQTQAVHPLKRAYDAVAARIFHALPAVGNGEGPARSDRERAAIVRAHLAAPAVTDALHHAASHRGQYMRPWEREPASIAHGIIDDETYDWLAVVRGIVTSGGYPVLVSEERLAEAHRLARETTGINVDPTGAAGLAGLLELLHPDGARPHEHVAVLFTGVQR